MADIWLQRAKEIGFDEAVPLQMDTLKPMQWVRDTCAAGRCNAYGHNWTCPPACGTLEECTRRMMEYSQGYLLQTVGELEKTIDTKGYAAVEHRHMQNIFNFSELLRKEYPDALCLGAGGCRICKICAYPKPCRFPEKATSSMEAYGLFVTQVCRDHDMKYYHGPKTITYTACALF